MAVAVPVGTLTAALAANHVFSWMAQAVLPTPIYNEVQERGVLSGARAARHVVQANWTVLRTAKPVA